MLKALEYLNDGYDWIVDIDLEKIFDTVNQDKLITIIRRTIKDEDVVSLISKYLKAGVVDKGVIKPTKVGTPQGGNLSPLLSNIMLNELDKELTARGLHFVRYTVTEIDEHLRTRLRVIIWKQWKKITRKEKALIQLGVEPALAHNVACTRKGYYQICKTTYI